MVKKGRFQGLDRATLPIASGLEVEEMAKKVAAVVFIYLCTVIAWLTLGSALMYRTSVQDYKMKGAVGQLWGSAQTQTAPSAHRRTRREVKVEKVKDGETISEARAEFARDRMPITSSDVRVNLSLDYRRKGLLWYSVYTVAFSGRYGLTNEGGDESDVHIEFQFPDEKAIYDDFMFLVDGQEVDDVSVRSGEVKKSIRLGPQETRYIEVSYSSQGMEQWWYSFGEDVSQIKEFSLRMTTDFEKIDFPLNSISPTGKEQTKDGWALEWKYANLFTGASIGMQLPARLNPGPWVSQVTFSAPVSLFLFFFLLFILTTVKGIRIHPINYFFLSAAFFSFHLLLAYLVDHISIHAGFLLSAAVSIFLVVSYMRLVVGKRFAFVEVAISQFVYLVLFSYTFFFRGFTGLAIALLCVITLYVTMQLTGSVNWDVILERGRGSE